MNDGSWRAWLKRSDVIQPGDIVIDGGANIGDFTTIFADKVGPTGYVYAFEPHPATAVQLRDRVPPHVQVIPAALGAIDGTGVLFTGGDSKQSSQFSSLVSHHEPTPIRISLMRLDTFLHSHCQDHAPIRPSFIKLDVQGAEANVLLGAGEALATGHAMWLIELWAHGLRVAGSSAEWVATIFMQALYHPWLIENEDPYQVEWSVVLKEANEKKEGAAVNVLVRRA